MSLISHICSLKAVLLNLNMLADVVSVCLLYTCYMYIHAREACDVYVVNQHLTGNPWIL